MSGSLLKVLRCVSHGLTFAVNHHITIFPFSFDKLLLVLLTPPPFAPSLGKTPSCLYSHCPNNSAWLQVLDIDFSNKFFFRRVPISTVKRHPEGPPSPGWQPCLNCCSFSSRNHSMASFVFLLERAGQVWEKKEHVETGGRILWRSQCEEHWVMASTNGNVACEPWLVSHLGRESWTPQQCVGGETDDLPRWPSQIGHLSFNRPAVTVWWWGMMGMRLVSRALWLGSTNLTVIPSHHFSRSVFFRLYSLHSHHMCAWCIQRCDICLHPMLLLST
jgi:hypothetical protein